MTEDTGDKGALRAIPVPPLPVVWTNARPAAPSPYWQQYVAAELAFVVYQLRKPERD